MCTQNCNNNCINMCAVNKQVKVVQFIHPGGEHQPSVRNIKNGKVIFPWNYGSHRRKYINTKGDYVDFNNNYYSNECLYFWGEWEPTSMVYPINPQPTGNNMPHYVHEPFFYPNQYPPYSVNGKNPTSYHRQNTDPFVFNEYFLYSLCKQDRYKVLKNLAPGSIILFGSPIGTRSNNPYFVLDTVFVVKDAIPYIPNNYQMCLRGLIPNNYDKIMGFADWNDNTPKYLYRGVSYKDRNDFCGMFSFVPCKIGSDGKAGFDRVILRHSNINYITDNLSQGIKTTVTSINHNIKLWNDICDIVKQHNCQRGFNFKY